MPTDITRTSPRAARNFALRAVAWSLGLFGVLRLGWIQAHGVLPLTQAQGALAASLFGGSALAVDVTLACSGADALALCIGTVLAYPVAWKTRLAGAAGGAGLILGLNVLRIGTLGQAAASPAWFNILHSYVWPAALAVAIAGFVFAWMRLADRPSSAWAPVAQVPRPTRRFLMLTAMFFAVFLAASPFYLESAAVLALAGVVARIAAATLGIFGVSAHATANALWTPRGGFLVTQECITTPLIPIYLGAVCAYSTSWPRRCLGLLATLPLFMALGVARLLVVALPAALVASPLFLVHAFFQLLLAAVLVFIAARWRHGRATALTHAAWGVAAGVLFAVLLGPLFTRMAILAAGTPIDDPQGAIAMLPAFQASFYVALWAAAFLNVGWRRCLAGLAALVMMQAAGLLALQALAVHTGLSAHIRDVRGWAVAGPLLMIAAVSTARKPR